MAQEMLVNQYESLYERLRVKECMLIKTYGQEGSNTSCSVDEVEEIVDQIVSYRDAILKYLDIVTQDDTHEMILEIGGKDAQLMNRDFYETYLKYLQLNEVCERFIGNQSKNESEKGTNNELDEGVNKILGEDGLMLLFEPS
jgi:protein subunit release factor A